jgi:hypothetical protein
MGATLKTAGTVWIVTKGKTVLAHCSPTPDCPAGMFWTFDKSLAMQYSRFAVANACAVKMGGSVDTLPVKA